MVGVDPPTFPYLAFPYSPGGGVGRLPHGAARETSPRSGRPAPYEEPLQVGGHEGGVVFEGGRLLKLCLHRSEIEFYTKTVGHPIFQPFLPQFYGAPRSPPM